MALSAKRGPVLFLGHGSPMNALAHNDFTRALNAWGAGHPRPKAIVAISAHWMTQGTFVSCQAAPKQVFDFYGFPEALYQVPYACPGDPALARRILKLLSAAIPVGEEKTAPACLDTWGIDHGTWTLLCHLYPEADIPVVQISLDMSQPPEYHYRLGEALRALRAPDLLILGSGNLVHNLSLIDWNENAPVTPWAHEMDDALKTLLLTRAHTALVEYPRRGPHARKGIPTLDHYLPLLYVLGLQEPAEKVRFIYEGMQHASLAMRCLELV